MVGHSYGGHALGVLPNHQLLDAFYVFGTGSGWHGWMPPLERLRIVLLWNLVGPLVTRWKGYLPFKRMGMGENLPLDVYRQWKRWQLSTLLLTTRHGRNCTRRLPRCACRLSPPTRWTTPGPRRASRDAFMQGYRNADWQAHTIQPDAHTGPIGHMGYFRPSSTAVVARGTGLVCPAQGHVSTTRQRSHPARGGAAGLSGQGQRRGGME